MKGITKSGFHFEVMDNALDDMELIDWLAEMEDNPLLIPKVVTRLLGAQQKKELYDHVRDEQGIPRPKAVMDEIDDIFDSTGEDGKNL